MECRSGLDRPNQLCWRLRRIGVTVAPRWQSRPRNAATENSLVAERARFQGTRNDRPKSSKFSDRQQETADRRGFGQPVVLMLSGAVPAGLHCSLTDLYVASHIKRRS